MKGRGRLLSTLTCGFSRKAERSLYGNRRDARQIPGYALNVAVRGLKGAIVDVHTSVDNCLHDRSCGLGVDKTRPWWV